MIDGKDDKIEQLRWQLQQQATNYRILFKQTMATQNTPKNLLDEIGQHPQPLPVEMDSEIAAD